jgi:hypothetical protein
VFKKLVVGAALSISSFAFAGPHHAVPLAPPPPPVIAPAPVIDSQQNDRFDVMQGRMLLRELDSGRGFRRNDLDAQIVAFITAERAESRRDSRQLGELLMDFSRVQGRFGYRATAEKRRVLSAAIEIAERDLRDGHRGNRGNHFGRR